MRLAKLLVLALILASVPARAYTLLWDTSNSRVIHPWSSPSLTYDYNLSDCPAGVSADQVLDTIRQALDAWNTVPSSNLAVSLGSSVSTTVAQAKAMTSGNPLIICDAAMSSDVGQDADGIPAAFVPVAVDPDWHLTFGIIYLNAESGKQANLANVYKIDSGVMPIVLAHEMGHSLGLGHSSDPNALMYFDASAKTTLNLSQDDLDGITYLYPRAEPGQGRIFGCATMGAVGGRGSGRSGRGARGGDGPAGGAETAAAAQLALIFGACALGVSRAKRGARAGLGRARGA